MKFTLLSFDVDAMIVCHEVVKILKYQNNDECLCIKG